MLSGNPFFLSLRSKPPERLVRPLQLSALLAAPLAAWSGSRLRSIFTGETRRKGRKRRNNALPILSMNLPEASQDAILGRANLSIVTWKGASWQMRF
jgi:hypothetical protein